MIPVNLLKILKIPTVKNPLLTPPPQKNVVVPKPIGS